jgi:hypothetical protein
MDSEACDALVLQKGRVFAFRKRRRRFLEPLAAPTVFVLVNVVLAFLASLYGVNKPGFRLGGALVVTLGFAFWLIWRHPKWSERLPWVMIDGKAVREHGAACSPVGVIPWKDVTGVRLSDRSGVPFVLIDVKSAKGDMDNPIAISPEALRMKGEKLLRILTAKLEAYRQQPPSKAMHYTRQIVPRVAGAAEAMDAFQFARFVETTLKLVQKDDAKRDPDVADAIGKVLNAAKGDSFHDAELASSFKAQSEGSDEKYFDLEAAGAKPNEFGLYFSQARAFYALFLLTAETPLKHEAVDDAFYELDHSFDDIATFSRIIERALEPLGECLGAATK